MPNNPHKFIQFSRLGFNRASGDNTLTVGFISPVVRRNIVLTYRYLKDITLPLPRQFYHTVEELCGMIPDKAVAASVNLLFHSITHAGQSGISDDALLTILRHVEEQEGLIRHDPDGVSGIKRALVVERPDKDRRVEQLYWECWKNGERRNQRDLRCATLTLDADKVPIAGQRVISSSDNGFDLIALTTEELRAVDHILKQKTTAKDVARQAHGDDSHPAARVSPEPL